MECIPKVCNSGMLQSDLTWKALHKNLSRLIGVTNSFITQKEKRHSCKVQRNKNMSIMEIFHLNQQCRYCEGIIPGRKTDSLNKVPKAEACCVLNKGQGDQWG